MMMMMMMMMRMMIMQVITDKIRDDEESGAVESDWKFAAMVMMIR